MVSAEEQEVLGGERQETVRGPRGLHAETGEPPQGLLGGTSMRCSRLCFRKASCVGWGAGLRGRSRHAVGQDP